ncbi:hypothetical protein ACS0TY_017367 [Phlomoides rotata]
MHPLAGSYDQRDEGQCRRWGCWVTGRLTRGGVFRDHFGVFWGCFAVSHGRGFAFEAELASAFYAIELTHEKGWINIWLESDSTYVMHFLKYGDTIAPWSLLARWHHVCRLLSAMTMVVSHIYREGNAVADRLTREEVHRYEWGSVPPSFLVPFLQRDLVSDHYRFSSF